MYTRSKQNPGNYPQQKPNQGVRPQQHSNQSGGFQGTFNQQGNYPSNQSNMQNHGNFKPPNQNMQQNQQQQFNKPQQPFTPQPQRTMQQMKPQTPQQGSQMSQQMKPQTPQQGSQMSQQMKPQTPQQGSQTFQQMKSQTPQQASQIPQQMKQQMQTPQSQSQQQMKQGGAAQSGTPQAQRLKPILKSSTPAPMGQTVQPGNQAQAQNQVQKPVQDTAIPPAPAPPSLSVDNGEDDDHQDVNDSEMPDTESQERPKWRRKGPALKVNRKLKRLRMNQRLRKTLQPKNAIMVLNELKAGIQFTFPEQQPSMPNSLFLVHAEIDGKTYVGQGLSKPLARQNAAENALKSLLLEKMTAAAMKARLDAEMECQTTQSTDSQGEIKDDNMDGSTSSTSELHEELPWSSLASFALYKLFLEWQNQGTVVPVPRPGLSIGKVKKEAKATTDKVLPPNALSVHPVMLLNQMRPGLIYTEISRAGNPPNTMFTLSVEIDNVDYTGTAKNKKDAKKLAAKSALSALYGLVYPEESKEMLEDVAMA